jgi:DNA-binding NarL/FixJ family response regulator
LDMIKVLIAGVEQEEKESILMPWLMWNILAPLMGLKMGSRHLKCWSRSMWMWFCSTLNISGNGYKLTEKIVELYPEVAVIIIERDLKEDTMRAAFFSGAKDVLLYPFAPSKLVDSIYRSYQQEKQKADVTAKGL